MRKGFIAIISLLAVNCMATPYYVSTTGNDTNSGVSWATARRTIQGGVDAATVNGDEVIVSNGTYGLSSQITISPGITVKSVNGSSTTIVDGSNSVRCFYVPAAWNVRIEGFTIRNGNVTGNGGGVYFATPGCVIDDCAFVSNTASIEAGGLWFSDVGIVSNSVFIGNKANTYDGGGIKCNGSLTVVNCAFTNNTAQRFGGAVNMWVGGSMSESTLTSNSATNNGGGLYVANNAAVTITNCVLTSNYSGVNGGGLFLGSGSLVDNCTFISNTASWEAGGIWFQSAGTVSNSVFIGNKANTYDGGGVKGVGNLTVGNSIFEDNSAQRFGGGISFSGAGTVSNSIFSGNAATVDGGGIKGSITVKNSAFTNNTAGRYGGAVQMWSGGNMYGCTLTGNSSVDSGGGLHIYLGSTIVSNCMFRSNISSNNWGGGALIQSGLVVDSTFTSNTAPTGGGLYFNNTGTVFNSTFMGNKTTFGDGGGVLCNQNVTFSDCSFEKNTGERWGGGLFFQVAGTVLNSTFIGNIVNTYDGGGIMGFGSLTIRNCSFEGNNAQRYAGGIGFWGGGNLESSTIAGNYAATAGGGIYRNSGSVYSTNNIIYFNDAPSGSNYSGTVTFSYTDTTPLPAGTGNIATDPLFIDAGSSSGTNRVYGNLRLQSGSPCIDVGTNFLWMTTGYDLDGNARLFNSIVDMGAYEYFIVPSGDTLRIPFYKNTLWNDNALWPR